ncbi:MAG: hypothetical protein AAF328_10585 [Planctomycetota bacterium]
MNGSKSCGTLSGLVADVPCKRVGSLKSAEFRDTTERQFGMAKHPQGPATTRAGEKSMRWRAVPFTEGATQMFTADAMLNRDLLE